MASDFLFHMSHPTDMSSPIKENTILHYDEKFTVTQLKSLLLSRNRQWQQIKNGSSTENGTLRTIVLACIDSRVCVEKLFQALPGELLVFKNAGNEITMDLLRSLLIAIYEIGARFLIILGHTHCGTSIRDNSVKIHHLQESLGKQTITKIEAFTHQSLLDFLGVFNQGLPAIQQNVLAQTETIRKYLTELIPPIHHPQIIPALYDVESGKVTFLS